MAVSVTVFFCAAAPPLAALPALAPAPAPAPAPTAMPGPVPAPIALCDPAAAPSVALASPVPAPPLLLLPATLGYTPPACLGLERLSAYARRTSSLLAPCDNRESRLRFMASAVKASITQGIGAQRTCLFLRYHVPGNFPRSAMQTQGLRQNEPGAATISRRW